MSNRPDPVLFAKISYYLSIASALIFLVTFLMGYLQRIEALSWLSVVGNAIWLVLLTGSVGAFMGYAASADFKRQPGPPEAMNNARVGFRVNLVVFLVTLALAIFAIIIRLMAGGTAEV